MSSPMSDDRFDRELRAFLNWQADQLDGAPSADEVSAAIAGGGSPRALAPPSSRLIWAIVLVGLLVAIAIGVALAGSQNHHDLAVVPPAPSGRASPSVSPTGTPATSPSGSGGFCSTPIKVSAAGAAASPPVAPASPVAGLTRWHVAFMVQRGAGFDLVVGDASGTWTVATITGDTLTRTGTGTLGWSADRSTILIAVGHEYMTLPGPACTDLVLAQADGSSAVKLTNDGPGQEAVGAALAPDGNHVAYSENLGSQILLVDRTGTTRVLDGAPACGALLWSPDSTELAIVCPSTVYVRSVIEGSTVGILPLPAGTEPATAAWSADGSRILVATVLNSEIGPLTVLSLDPRSGVVSEVARSSLSLQRETPFQGDAISPDGRWLLATGGTPVSANDPNPFQPALYAVDVASGAARQLFGPNGPGGATWLPDSTGLVFFDPADPSGRRLVQERIDGSGRRPFGTFPLPNGTSEPSSVASDNFIVGP